MNDNTEAALVQALITNTPEALLRLLTSSSTTEPDAAAAALVEAIAKQYVLAKALAATTAARLSLIHISEPTRPERISYAVFCMK